MYLAWICYKAFVSKWTPPLGSRDPKSSPLNASHWIEFIASFAYPPLPQRDPKTRMNSRKSSALEYWPTSEVVTEKSIWSEPLYQIIWVIHFFIFIKCFFCCVCMHISSDEFAALSLVPRLTYGLCSAQVLILRCLFQGHLHSYKSRKTS